MGEKRGVGKGVFDVGERCGGSVCPYWHVGGPLGVLEEGIEWLDGGRAVRDEASIKINQSDELPQLALGCRKREIANHLDYLL